MSDWIKKMQESAAKTQLLGTPPGLRPQTSNSPGAKLDRIERLLSSASATKK
jgi:hypothetical protein